MKLTDILAISGQSGLFRFIAQSSNGIIVESLTDGKRMNASGSAKVSSLGEISVYTDQGDKQLSDILTSIYEHTGGKEAMSHKSPADELKKYFAVIVPDYDRDMVHVSDMKKMISWYNILLEAGMTDFSVDTESEAEQAEEDAAAETTAAE